MPHNYCLITITTGSREEAERLAQMLVDARLAACVQIMPTESFFNWQDSLHKEKEWLLHVKTRLPLYKQVESAVLEQHTYENSEILCLPIVLGSAAYLDWIDESTKSR
ncbi:MAG: divalent-cation tolerance protein CutA [Chloroflexi bacterium]|nr:divalent-cation tolerance protein CutA [Chloroflexota bacterium]